MTKNETTTKNTKQSPERNTSGRKVAALKKTTIKKQPVTVNPVPDNEKAVTLGDFIGADRNPNMQEIKNSLKITPKRKILFVASECTPFIATGGLAEVVGSLSKTLAQDENYDVRVVLPLYSDIRADYRSRFKYLFNIYVPLSWRNQYCGVFSYVENGVTFYFLDNE